MRVGSLFSGIGGLDLGLERADFEIAWQVEVDHYCQKVLARHWPDVERFEDVRAVGAHNLVWTDVIVGGFPCQDISSAGKRAGITGERSGLWREFARIIEEVRPRYVLIENVAALLYATKKPDGTRREAAIETVLRDLAAIGYDAEWRVCSAAEFGAPHLRKRVFIVAYDPCQRGRTWRTEPEGQQRPTDVDGNSAAAMENSPGSGQQKRECTTGLHREFESSSSLLADAYRTRLEEWGRRAGAQWEGTAAHRCGGHQGQIVAGVGRIFDGFSARLDGIEQRWPAGPGQEQFEWEPPRVIQGKLQDRVPRLKGLGNSALPQIAEAIGWAIKRHAGEDRT